MKKTEKESEEFKKYREQMHGVEYEEEPRYAPGRAMRVIFSIFMIIVYIGMGILLILPSNFFGFDPQFEWIRITVGVLLIIYGIWRSYRAYAGIDTRL